jgi:hypothetical protein
MDPGSQYVSDIPPPGSEVHSYVSRGTLKCQSPCRISAYVKVQ